MPRSRVLWCALGVLLLIGWTVWSESASHAGVTTANPKPEAARDLSDLLSDNEGRSLLPLPPANLGIYYSMKRDMRRCAAPLCGGYFISGVNQSKTRCANGKYEAQCYVAEIAWNGEPPVDDPRNKTLARGSLTAKTFPRFGKLGLLRVSESWNPASDDATAGTFYRVRDLGVRCITHPCNTHEESKLNSTSSRKIAGADLTGVGANEDRLSRAHEAMTSAEGIVVTGTNMPVKGPAGNSVTLKAYQFFLRATKSTSETDKPNRTKACIKTGCSGIICSDQELMSTCEWKDEYECYRTARCERQRNGQCGFTETPELTACIASKRK